MGHTGLCPTHVVKDGMEPTSAGQAETPSPIRWFVHGGWGGSGLCRWKTLLLSVTGWHPDSPPSSPAGLLPLGTVACTPSPVFQKAAFSSAGSSLKSLYSVLHMQGPYVAFRARLQGHLHHEAFPDFQKPAVRGWCSESAYE